MFADDVVQCGGNEVDTPDRISRIMSKTTGRERHDQYIKNKVDGM